MLAKPALFEHIHDYAKLVDEVAPWHCRIKIRAQEYLQFSKACVKHYPAHYFKEDPKLGSIGIHIDIVANWLHQLRFKGEAASSQKVRATSTVLNMLQETKVGLREHLGADFQYPPWMTAGPKQFFKLRQLLQTWKKVDVQHMPPKAYLLEEHVEQFCLEAIWYHMQVCIGRWTIVFGFYIIFPH